ncbi:MAG TPA: transcription antitermination factor NusB [Rickettsia endosymbiont of Pyrocoelia pectoralis]|nr:transcription antitermination factor NusB [Rickettsia endosymbiont of Pyrocoelia pectoralis]
MSSNKINKKSIARIAAVQAIYQYTLQDSNDIEAIMQDVLSFYQDDYFAASSDENLKISLTISHFEMLVKLVFENTAKIDEIINSHLVNDKNPDHMPVLLRALLRVSISELLLFKATPVKVVINEYTDIANEMLNEHEIGFVNSVLDKIAKENKEVL